MTTLLTPTVTTRPPRVPLPHLLRAAWYRQRIAILSMLAFYVLVAGFVLYQYFSLRLAFDTRHLSLCLTGPTVTFSPTCETTLFSVVSTFEVDGIVVGVAIVPAVAVIFGGIRWLSREYESGGFRFTWAQASSPARWFTVSGLPLLTATIAGAALTWAAYHQWHAITWMQLDGDNAYSEYGFVFSPGGFLALSFAAFGLGVLAAATIRRTVPAMAASLAVYAGLLAAMVFKFLPWLLSLHAVTIKAAFTFAELPAGEYFVRDWWTDGAGRVVPGWPGNGGNFNGLVPAPWGTLLDNGSAAARAKWAAAHHVTYWMSYQPADRIGMFHAIWVATLLLVGLLASGLALWQVRSR
jgi:hypothetical protein